MARPRLRCAPVPLSHSMKILPLFAFFALGIVVLAQTTDSKTALAAGAKLPSTIVDWQKLVATRTANGERRNVIDGPTTTLDKLHIHITTLNPGKASSEPHLHPQEEVIIVKEGLVEASVDGRTQIVGPGSV